MSYEDDKYDWDREERPLISHPKISSSEPKKPYVARYSKLSVFLIFIFPALGGLLFGYDIGATSSVLTQLKSSSKSGVDWSENVSNSTFLQGLITSLGVGGAMLGSIICFKVSK